MENIKHKLWEDMKDTHRNLWFEDNVRFEYVALEDKYKEHWTVTCYRKFLSVPMIVPISIKNYLIASPWVWEE